MTPLVIAGLPQASVSILGGVVQATARDWTLIWTLVGVAGLLTMLGLVLLLRR